MSFKQGQVGGGALEPGEIGGFLSVLALHIARFKATLQTLWASGGHVTPPALQPDEGGRTTWAAMLRPRRSAT
jgi:hypothetical protein